MMPITVSVNLHADQYRALCKLADAKSANENRPVQVHHLLEDLVRRALSRTAEPRPAQPAPEPEPEPTPPPARHGRVPAVDLEDPTTVMKLELLHGMNMTLHQTADALGVKYDAVRVAYRKLGLKPAPSAPKIDPDRVASLHAEGMADTEIAAALGATAAGVRLRRVAMGLPSNGRMRKPATAVDEAELRRLHSLGLVDRQIGEQIGVTGSTVCSHRIRLGLPKNGKQGRKFKSQEAAA